MVIITAGTTAITAITILAAADFSTIVQDLMHLIAPQATTVHLVMAVIITAVTTVAGLITLLEVQAAAGSAAVIMAVAVVFLLHVLHHQHLLLPLHLVVDVANNL